MVFGISIYVYRKQGSGSLAEICILYPFLGKSVLSLRSETFLIFPEC